MAQKELNNQQPNQEQNPEVRIFSVFESLVHTEPVKKVFTLLRGQGHTYTPSILLTTCREPGSSKAINAFWNSNFSMVLRRWTDMTLRLEFYRMPLEKLEEMFMLYPLISDTSPKALGYLGAIVNGTVFSGNVSENECHEFEYIDKYKIFDDVIQGDPDSTRLIHAAVNDFTRLSLDYRLKYNGEPPPQWNKDEGIHDSRTRFPAEYLDPIPSVAHVEREIHEEFMKRSSKNHH